jgi:hypothetical protein
MKSITLKTFTLAGFIVMLICFVAFKTGALDEYLNATTGKPLPDNALYRNDEGVPTDTPQVKVPDTVKYNPAMFPTSKSLIVIDQKLEFSVKDSLKNDTITRQLPKK